MVDEDLPTVTSHQMFLRSSVAVKVSVLSTGYIDMDSLGFFGR